jgi:16S rRNA (guanine1516-N2)-methyltransferase
LPDPQPSPASSEALGNNARGFVFELRESTSGLVIHARHHPQYGDVGIDWASADLRRRIGAGRKQLLARAVGLHKKPQLRILDATAGLGRDAYTLAALGAELWLAERQPLFVKLLENALLRARKDASIQAVAERMHLLPGDAREHLQNGDWDVIYIDPMYPGHERDALSKKEMQFLRELTGGDPDAAEVLKLALVRARERVVVKRPLSAPQLGERAPSFSLKGTQARFDVYLTPPSRSA